MALNPAQLRSQFQILFERRLSNEFDIASKIAKSYYAYAVAAQAPPGVPVVLRGTESRLLELELVKIMKSRLQGIQAAQAVGRAITAFWLAPPVLTSSGGAANSILVTTGVSKLVATRSDTVRDAAQSLAQSLDLMTRTVFIANPPPAPSGILF